MQPGHTSENINLCAFFRSKQLLYLEGSFNMDVDDQVPVGVSHVLEADVPQDARIVE